MLKTDIENVLKLCASDNKQLVINNKYVCEFNCDNEQLFSDELKEDICPRYARYADVIVYELSGFSKKFGRLFAYRDVDIDNMLTMSLCLTDDKFFQILENMISVVNLKIEDARIKVKDFMKLIDYKPLYEIKEPYDACGLEVCQFKEYNKHFPNIEFGLDGRLYYEIVDETNYNEGDFIPLNSAMRKDVINYVKLTQANMKDIANKINASLKKLYEN